MLRGERWGEGGGGRDGPNETLGRKWVGETVDT